jgi:hypothetical protein
MTDEPAEYDLVMPFVACASQGGPYDDDSFVAGFHAGALDRSLGVIEAAGGTGMRATVNAALVPQLELVAMRYGYTLKITESGTATWVYAEFHKPRETTP